MIHPQLKEIFDTWRKDTGRQYKIMTYGASESHFSYHSHARPTWFHWLEKSLRTDSIHFVMLNASQGGNCIRDLCGRFERDLLPLKPDLCIVSMGGNDARVPVPLDEFREKTVWLCRQIQDWGGIPVLQTIYSPVFPAYPPDFSDSFPQYMALNREIAAALGIPCLDIYRYFKPLYEAGPERYAQALMTDSIHVNGIGNAVWGCLVCEEMGLPKPALAELEDAVAAELAAIRALAGEG